MARNISKKNVTLFKKQVVEIIERFPHKNEGRYSYQWTIPTGVGDLYISLHDEMGSIYSIFMMFEEPERAKVHFEDCNHASGKYNIHMSNKDCVLATFFSTLEKATNLV